ncbi:hypothetical protein ACFL0S_01035 [Thermodesulfobacteriota bacterium]
MNPELLHKLMQTSPEEEYQAWLDRGVCEATALIMSGQKRSTYVSIGRPDERQGVVHETDPDLLGIFHAVKSIKYSSEIKEPSDIKEHGRTYWVNPPEETASERYAWAHFLARRGVKPNVEEYDIKPMSRWRDETGAWRHHKKCGLEIKISLARPKTRVRYRLWQTKTVCSPWRPSPFLSHGFEEYIDGGLNVNGWMDLRN